VNTLIKKYRLLLVTRVVVLAFFPVSQFSKLTINPSYNDYIRSGAGSTLLLIPAIITITKPRFLEPQLNSTVYEKGNIIY